MAETMPVVFMADDAYAGWAGRFLASLREQAPGVTVLCIPYSDRLERIAALRAEFGFTMVEADFAAIDAFADECFPGRSRAGATCASSPPSTCPARPTSISTATCW